MHSHQWIEPKDIMCVCGGVCFKKSTSILTRGKEILNAPGVARCSPLSEILQWWRRQCLCHLSSQEVISYFQWKIIWYVHPCCVLHGPEQEWLKNLEPGVHSCMGQNLASAHFTGRCLLGIGGRATTRSGPYREMVLSMECRKISRLSGLLTHLPYSSLYVDQLSLSLYPHKSQNGSLSASPPLKRPCQLDHNLLVLISESRRGKLIQWPWVKGPLQSDPRCPGGRWC